MFFSPFLEQGILLKRYKRFLADIRRADGSLLTVHCPNTGAMRRCSSAGSLAAFSLAVNPGRKYPHTLEMVQDNGVWVGVNTSRTNSIVREAIVQGKIRQWQDVDHIQGEVRISSKTRLDFCLTHRDSTTTMVEVKSCSLAENNLALFPDTVTVRGTKHLDELTTLAGSGQKSAIFYLVQRQDAQAFRPAAEIDTRYAQSFIKAVNAGVQALVYQVEISPAGIEVVRELPFAGEYASIVRGGINTACPQ